MEKLLIKVVDGIDVHADADIETLCSVGRGVEITLRRNRDPLPVGEADKLRHFSARRDVPDAGRAVMAS